MPDRQINAPLDISRPSHYHDLSSCGAVSRTSRLPSGGIPREKSSGRSLQRSRFSAPALQVSLKRKTGRSLPNLQLDRCLSPRPLQRRQRTRPTTARRDHAPGELGSTLEQGDQLCGQPGPSHEPAELVSRRDREFHHSLPQFQRCAPRLLTRLSSTSGMSPKP